MSGDVDLARSLVFIAGDLDRRHYPYVGVIRRAARALVDMPDRSDGCRGCGEELDQPRTGRRRVWCSERCRRRKRP